MWWEKRILSLWCREYQKFNYHICSGYYTQWEWNYFSLKDESCWNGYLLPQVLFSLTFPTAALMVALVRNNSWSLLFTVIPGSMLVAGAPAHSHSFQEASPVCRNETPSSLPHSPSLQGTRQKSLCSFEMSFCGLQVLTCKLMPMHCCAGLRVPQDKTDKQGPNNDPRFHEKVHSELTLVWNPYKVVLGSRG